MKSTPDHQIFTTNIHLHVKLFKSSFSPDNKETEKSPFSLPQFCGLLRFQVHTGVNFINILKAVFLRIDLESIKRLTT